MLKEPRVFMASQRFTDSHFPFCGTFSLSTLHTYIHLYLYLYMYLVQCRINTQGISNAHQENNTILRIQFNTLRKSLFSFRKQNLTLGGWAFNHFIVSHLLPKKIIKYLTWETFSYHLYFLVWLFFISNFDYQ